MISMLDSVPTRSECVDGIHSRARAFSLWTGGDCINISPERIFQARTYPSDPAAEQKKRNTKHTHTHTNIRGMEGNQSECVCICVWINKVNLSAFDCVCVCACVNVSRVVPVSVL